MGQNWLVVTDAYTKYPCIHSTTSVSSRSTIDLLEEDFAHFGYPHSIVSDNANSFTSEEFQTFCKDKGIIHHTGAPYYPATNGAAEHLIQSFKQAVRKSSSSPKKATLEFLMQYRRTPTTSGYSPSELLNNRQLRTKIDTLIPSPAHIAQGKLKVNNPFETKRNHMFKAGDDCYTLHFGPLPKSGTTLGSRSCCKKRCSHVQCQSNSQRTHLEAAPRPVTTTLLLC